MGAYYEQSGFHLEAEYLRKFYANNAFNDCNAVNVIAIYRHPVSSHINSSTKGGAYIQAISYLMRYDYMDDHSDGKKGFAESSQSSVNGTAAKVLTLTDAQRHRLTAGLTFSVANKYFPTDIRLNYEKYWYPHGGAKESEQDKIVAELMIRF